MTNNNNNNKLSNIRKVYHGGRAIRLVSCAGSDWVVARDILLAIDGVWYSHHLDFVGKMYKMKVRDFRLCAGEMELWLIRSDMILLLLMGAERSKVIDLIEFLSGYVNIFTQQREQEVEMFIYNIWQSCHEINLLVKKILALKDIMFLNEVVVRSLSDSIGHIVQRALLGTSYHIKDNSYIWGLLDEEQREEAKKFSSERLEV